MPLRELGTDPLRVTGTKVLPGDFCAVPVGGPVGPLISFASWLDNLGQHDDDLQKYEHAEIYVGDPSGQYPNGLTCSAYPDRQGIKVLDCPPEQLPGAIWSSGVIPLTDAQRAGIVGWCYDHANVTYSALDYFALTLHRFGLSTTWLRNRIGSSKQYICSQFVDAAYLANGIHLFDDGRWPGYVKPVDLADIIESRTRG